MSDVRIEETVLKESEQSPTESDCPDALKGPSMTL